MKLAEIISRVPYTSAVEIQVDTRNQYNNRSCSEDSEAMHAGANLSLFAQRLVDVELCLILLVADPPRLVL